MLVLDISRVNLEKGTINKVLSRKVLTKLITSPGSAYFSTKKNRNVKEPIVSSPLDYKSVHSSLSDNELEVSRKEMLVLDISRVNLIEKTEM
jgi:hypothetical protein